MVVFLDLVILLNIMVDLLLLLGANVLTGYPSRLGRSVGAAILGGAYSGACLIPGFAFLGNSLWRLVSLALMGGLAFGWNRASLCRWGVFLLLTFALGGLAAAMNRGGWMVLLWAAGLWLLCVILPGSAGNRRYLPVQIRYAGRTVTFLALEDTGNLLRDPITGEGVMVLGPEETEKLTGLTPAQLKEPMAALERGILSGLRLIPCRTLGGSGLLLCRRFGDVIINGKKRGTLVAFAPEPLGNGIQALTGGGFR